MQIFIRTKILLFLMFDSSSMRVYTIHAAVIVWVIMRSLMAMKREVVNTLFWVLFVWAEEMETKVTLPILFFRFFHLLYILRYSFFFRIFLFKTYINWCTSNIHVLFTNFLIFFFLQRKSFINCHAHAGQWSPKKWS